MAQIADKCPGIIQFCRTRVTLLDDDGTPASPVQYYVSDKMVTLTVNSDVEEGQRRTVRSGCGCPVVTRRDQDLLLGYTFELVDGVWEPAMTQLMLGSEGIEDQSDVPVIIGENIPSPSDANCGDAVAQVALEGWSYAWDGSGQDADLGLIHFLWPLTKWQRGSFTLGEDAATQTLTGFNETNNNWYDLYLDIPTDGTTEIDVNFFAWWMEDVANLPTADCAIQSTT